MLLHSRTESDVEVDRTKLPVTTSQVLRLEASTSGILNENVEDRGISTSTFNSRVNCLPFLCLPVFILINSFCL